MKKTSCLIIGRGAAGLVSGISFLKKRPDKNCLIIGEQLSNSRISPWNIMIAEEQEIKKRILNAGDYKNSQELVDVFAEKSNESVSFLEDNGIIMKKSNIGKVPVFLGSEVIERLEKKFKQLNGEIIEKRVTQLLKKNNKIKGVVLNDGTNIIADKIIIASGGLTNLYKYTTGANTNIPNIIALLHEAGLKINNLEFNMFHPFFIIDNRLPKALVSGEILQKARFIDEENNEFLSEKIKKALRENHHHNVFPEMVKEFFLKSLDSKIFMDISENTQDYFEEYKNKNEFGGIFKNKKLSEINKFEIHPAFHFSIGGIEINSKTETNLENVYAVGEASTGLHGTNRIGGFAISEAIVFGKIAGEIASKNLNDVLEDEFESIGNSLITNELKEKVWKFLGPVKEKSKLLKFKSEIQEKENKSSEEKLILEMINSSLKKSSIGTHFIK